MCDCMARHAPRTTCLALLLCHRSEPAPWLEQITLALLLLTKCHGRGHASGWMHQPALPFEREGRPPPEDSGDGHARCWRSSFVVMQLTVSGVKTIPQKGGGIVRTVVAHTRARGDLCRGGSMGSGCHKNQGQVMSNCQHSRTDLASGVPTAKRVAAASLTASWPALDGASSFSLCVHKAQHLRAHNCTQGLTGEGASVRVCSAHSSTLDRGSHGLLRTESGRHSAHGVYASLAHLLAQQSAAATAMARLGTTDAAHGTAQRIPAQPSPPRLTISAHAAGFVGRLLQPSWG